jgi:hypothetical protein
MTLFASRVTVHVTPHTNTCFMIKTCPGCRRSLDASEFNFKNRATARLQVYCRECSREYIRKHYRRNTEYYCRKARIRSAVVRQDLRQRLLEYFREHHCVDCGEADPVVLQFDHRDRSNKSADVAELVKRRVAWRTIRAEIEKCVVRCANDHARRTASQFGWYRLDSVSAPVAQLDRAPVFGTGGLRVQALPGAPPDHP